MCVTVTLECFWKKGSLWELCLVHIAEATWVALPWACPVSLGCLVCLHFRIRGCLPAGWVCPCLSGVKTLCLVLTGLSQGVWHS